MDAKPKTLLIFSIFLILPALMIARIVPYELDSLLDPEKGSGGNNVQQVSSSSGVDDGNNDSTGKNLIKELTSDNQDNYTNARVEAHLDNPKYFEGDLIISEEEILEAYGPIMGTTSSHPIRNKRGAKVDKRWPNGIVYYDFHSSVGSELRRIIERAIEEFEQKTCLNFQLAPVGPDCIMFTANGDGCTSSVGKVGGLQYITLPNLGSLGTCQTHGITLHEIGHAIGFWHEQRRPDRDHYVTIHLENIKNSQHHNFGIREDVNYQGVTYDYQFNHALLTVCL